MKSKGVLYSCGERAHTETVIERDWTADDRARLVVSDALAEEKCVVQDVVVGECRSFRRSRRAARELIAAHP